MDFVIGLGVKPITGSLVLNQSSQYTCILLDLLLRALFASSRNFRQSIIRVFETAVRANLYCLPGR
jgi:hypothetical protein